MGGKTKGKAKKLYKVVLNWQGEIHTIYRYASGESNALHLSFVCLANKLGFSQATRIKNYFLGSENRIEIKEVKVK